MPGPAEFAFLAIVALLVFGPERLPKIARSAGQMLAKLRAEASGTLDELKRAADIEDLESVRDELRAAGRDLRGVGDDLSRAAGGGKRRAVGAGAATPATRSRRTLPAPFDPDAT